MVLSCGYSICLKNHRNRRRNQALRGQGNPDDKLTSGSLTLAIGATILAVNVPLAASTHVAVGDEIASLTMPAFVYTVALSVNEAAPQKGWLVEVLCTHHKKSPKQSACQVAEAAVKQHFGAEATVGYRAASEYTGALPSNLGTAHFTAQCGCRAWSLPF